MQETWVQSLILENATSHGATKPMNLNFQASGLKPGGHKKRSHHKEKLTYHN